MGMGRTWKYTVRKSVQITDRRKGCGIWSWKIHGQNMASTFLVCEMGRTDDQGVV
jgi:hypothetical protein